MGTAAGALMGRSREIALIERLVGDPVFRRTFLGAPEQLLHDLGLGELAPAAMSSDGPRLIDARESRSGLGGLAAVAVAAITAIEFVDQADAASPTAAATVPVEPVVDPDVSVGVPAAVTPIDASALIGPNAGGVLHASEFDVPDPEGAHSDAGRFHAGYDLFAAAGAPVRTPVAGVVIEASPSRGMSGQVFGGVVKVQGADGRIWVFRHVVPGAVGVGATVPAGQEIATVSPWTGGTPHVHLELWRTREGGYRVENMDDPYVDLARVYPGRGSAVPPASAGATGVSPPAGTSPTVLSKGRASGVFQIVGATNPPVGASGASGPVEVPVPVDIDAGPVGEYPGDAAPREAIARWMATQAQAAGLPPELPVMASLVESGLRNLSYGDRDSVGFFQMRTGIWNSGAYTGYPERPELQMRWFIDRALALKADRIAGGDTTFGRDPATFGNWVADVERPAEQYRGRYQLRLDEAQQLLRFPRP